MNRTLAAACSAALLSLAAVPAGADTAKVTRSTAADPGEYPAQVALLSTGTADNADAQFCGGTLIDPAWVLTAAHCFTGDGQVVDVLVGTNLLDGSGTRIRGTAVVNPAFDFPTNDIALVRLPTAASAPVAPLALDGMESLEAPGTPAVVTGWGGLRADETSQEFPVALQEGNVPVIGDDQCDAELNVGGRDDLPDAFKPSLVCAGAGTSTSDPEEPDACRGDSGGPLWATGPDGVRRQIGLVSGGPTCGRSPTYYTSVEASIRFIEDFTGRQFASFVDIPGDVHEPNIERIVLADITGGFPDGTYRPDTGVTRGQLSTFVASALDLQPVADGPFTDVDGTTHAGTINAAAAAGIVSGFSDGTFRPGLPVTREQMATFLARALELAPVEVDRFNDIATSVHRTNINALSVAGVAGGFPDGGYRPTIGVTRAQMASFLANGFLR